MLFKALNKWAITNLGLHSALSHTSLYSGKGHSQGLFVVYLEATVYSHLFPPSKEEGS